VVEEEPREADAVHEEVTEVFPADEAVATVIAASATADDVVAAGVVSEDEQVRVDSDGTVSRRYDRVERPPVRRRRGFDEIGWALLALLVLVLVALGAWWYLVHRGPEKRTVPVVTGEPAGTAVNQLQSRGFKTRISSQTHPGRPGTVFGQSPGGGARVNKGSTVGLLVSKGLATVVVPNAVGLADATARDRLVSAGFKVTETRVFAKDPPGTVVAQNPAAGSKVAKSSAVQINVSKGTGVAIVPNVVGLSVGAAETQLAKAKLTGVVQFHVASAKPVGTVVAQAPPGGQAKIGSKVQLNISKGTGTAPATTPTGATGPTVPTATTP
jgi:serine/threonine-protein kinase